MTYGGKNCGWNAGRLERPAGGAAAAAESAPTADGLSKMHQRDATTGQPVARTASCRLQLHDVHQVVLARVGEQVLVAVPRVFVGRIPAPYRGQQQRRRHLDWHRQPAAVSRIMRYRVSLNLFAAGDFNMASGPSAPCRRYRYWLGGEAVPVIPVWTGGGRGCAIKKK